MPCGECGYWAQQPNWQTTPNGGRSALCEMCTAQRGVDQWIKDVRKDKDYEALMLIYNVLTDLDNHLTERKAWRSSQGLSTRTRGLSQWSAQTAAAAATSSAAAAAALASVGLAPLVFRGTHGAHQARYY